MSIEMGPPGTVEPTGGVECDLDVIKRVVQLKRRDQLASEFEGARLPKRRVRGGESRRRQEPVEPVTLAGAVLGWGVHHQQVVDLSVNVDEEALRNDARHDQVAL